mgnify:CR=1 FL=1
MKYRHGFVSNSSTSSFICEICGNTESGMDCSAEELGFIECDNGHEICQEEAIEGYQEAMDARNEAECKADYGEEGYFEEENLPSEYCPICNFEVPSMPDIERYFHKQYGIPDSEVFDYVKKINPRRKKLYPHEYNEYVMRQKELRIEDVLAMLKTQYNGSYHSFKKDLKS